ncbi:hypothetical protein H9P43_009756 [Blastocladiella emersonii ATCC 22665]|nr:hypothetical protein H9P43_009756 [Blastocladiella emersonii ATCC 22665]
MSATTNDPPLATATAWIALPSRPRRTDLPPRPPPPTIPPILQDLEPDPPTFPPVLVAVIVLGSVFVVAMLLVLIRAVKQMRALQRTAQVYRATPVSAILAAALSPVDRERTLRPADRRMLDLFPSRARRRSSVTVLVERVHRNSVRRAAEGTASPGNGGSLRRAPPRPPRQYAWSIGHGPAAAWMDAEIEPPSLPPYAPLDYSPPPSPRLSYAAPAAEPPRLPPPALVPLAPPPPVAHSDTQRARAASVLVAMPDDEADARAPPSPC